MFRVFRMESMAAVDGIGLRLCIFLSGCPLHCAYCHNPECHSAEISYENEEILHRARRMKPYFQASGGGITFSGGEPLLQADAIVSLSAGLHAEGIGYTLDSSGCLPPVGVIREAIDLADMVICDLKFPDEMRYQALTGGNLSDVLRTLRYLRDTGKKTWVRTVILPGINDQEEDLRAYAELLCENAAPDRWQLLPFHTLGFSKYEQLGIRNPLIGMKSMDLQRLASLQTLADSLLFSS